MAEFHFSLIGRLHGGGVYPQEAPRQSTLAVNTGVIELLPGRNFEAALADLAGFERIWLLFVFDRNTAWRPTVMPPDGSAKRRGLFATRSPHRPNPIGLSAVELVKVEGRFIHICNFDLLDGTPILDIKPYIPMADAFPLSRAGWRDEVPQPEIQLFFTPAAEERIAFLRANGGPDLANAARVQLATRELDPKRQRLTPPVPGSNLRKLAFRTWRIVFECGETRTVTDIQCGYSPEELAPESPDPYGDKELHRKFRLEYKPVSEL